MDGVVTTRSREEGEMVGVGTPLVTLSRLDEVWLSIYVPESHLGRVKLGQAAKVRIDGDGRRFDGLVTFISPEAEFTPRNVQTPDERAKLVYRVKITLKNPDGVFKPGMPADGYPGCLPMSQPPSAPALVTRGLARSFGKVSAVTSLDLTVRRGEMFGLVGPDGAGKSTAIRLLCGILRPTGGEGHVLGFDLNCQGEQLKSRIGYLSQNFTLYGDLTVDENLEFFAELHGVRDFRRRRDELLEFTRLAPFRRRLAQALSGGMKKKLALASTLIHTPEMIFLDEPSTGVDPVSRGEFWNILSGILEQGVTIVMTTPYLDEAERCHRISLMHGGKTFMTGTPDEVKAVMPGKVYSIVCPSAPTAYRSLRAGWPSTQLVVFGDRIHFWTPRGQPDVLACMDWLDRASLGPASFTEVEPSLEDAFVALLVTGRTLEHP